MERIEDLVIKLSKDPFSPAKNFEVAKEYEKLNQTASAVSFYLRTAEYSTVDKDPLVYASLLKMAHCFNDQKDRQHTVTNCLLQAIAYWPDRPEAYFLMAQFYERTAQWQEAYTYAEVGLNKPDFEPLPVETGYHGKYCLEFEKAVSAYWIGRKEESVVLLLKLRLQDIAEEYRSSVTYNLRQLNVTF